MMSADPLQSIDEGLSPLHELVAVSAGSARTALRLLFMLDARCARIRRMTREMMMGQIRLAWLRDALVVPVDSGTESGDPLVDALRTHPVFGACQPYVARMVDGWEELLVGMADPASGEGPDRIRMLRAFAMGRGGGGFAAILAIMGREVPASIEQPAMIWALWSIAGELGNDAVATTAVDLGAELAKSAARLPLPRPLAILASLSRADMRRGRGAPAAMTVPLYLRVLRLQILGR